MYDRPKRKHKSANNTANTDEFGIILHACVCVYLCHTELLKTECHLLGVKGPIRKILRRKRLI